MTHHYSVRLRAILLAMATFVIASGSLMAQWSTLPSLPAVRTWTQQAIVGGKVYVFGGADANGVPKSEAWVLDLANTAAGWTSLPNMPLDRAAGYAGVVDGKIYLVNGVGVEANSLAGRTTVLEYNTTTNTYTPKSASTVGPWFVSGTVLGSKIYVAGGNIILGQGLSATNVVQIYDAATDVWTTGTALPQPYYSGHAVTMGNDVYFIGGRLPNAVHTGVLKLANGTGNWQTVTGATMPTPAFDGSVGMLNGKVYIAGGGSVSGEITATQVYDPVANTWTSSYPLPTKNASGGVLVTDGTSLYMVGGTSGQALKLDVGVERAVADVSTDAINIAAKVGTTGVKTFTIDNLGVIALTGTITVPNDAAWLSVSPSNLNVDAAGTSVIELSAAAGSLAAGVYSTTITVNTNDENNPTIPIAVKFYVVDNLVEQETKVVLEEATGNWCPPCGAAGTPEIRRLSNIYGERLITIAYHDRGGRPTEPMATAQTEAMTAKLGVPYWPAAAVQRIDWPEEAGLMTGTDTWQMHIDNVLAAMPMAPAAIEVVSYDYNRATRRITAKLKITTADAIEFDGATMKLTAVVMEDSLEYTQAGTSESPYFHMHVARSFWPSIDGQTVTLPTGAVDNAVLLPGKEMTIDANWNVTGVTVPENAHVVFILSMNQGSQTGMILQGHEMSLLGEQTGPAAQITVTGDAAQKTITVGETAEFNTTVMNVGEGDIEVTVDRTSNTMPAGGWTSKLCVDGDCSSVTTNKVVHILAPGASATFGVQIMGATAAASGVVGIRVSAGDTSVSKTYTAITGPSGVEIETGANRVLALSAFPNPTSGAARVEFTMPTSGSAKLELFASNGEKIVTLVDGRREAGRQSEAIDLAKVQAGVYTVVLTVGDRVSTSTITVVR